MMKQKSIYMRQKAATWLLLVVLAVLTHSMGAYSADVSNGMAERQDECLYQFFRPVFPTFDLPPRMDMVLNPFNPIVRGDKEPMKWGQGCNGDNAYYVDDETGELVNVKGIFYATGFDKIYFRGIQPHDYALFDSLRGRTIRLDVLCENTVNSCVQFMIANGPVSQTRGWKHPEPEPVPAEEEDSCRWRMSVCEELEGDDDDGDDDCDCVMRDVGCIAVMPGNSSVECFFGMDDSKCEKNTNTGYETPGTGLFFMYENCDGTYLSAIMGDDEDCRGSVSMEMSADVDVCPAVSFGDDNITSLDECSRSQCLSWPEGGNTAAAWGPLNFDQGDCLWIDINGNNGLSKFAFMEAGESTCMATMRGTSFRICRSCVDGDDDNGDTGFDFDFDDDDDDDDFI